MQIQLFTRNGERVWTEVATLEIARHDPPPAVIVYQARIFQWFPGTFAPGAGVLPKYGEVVGYVVPDAPGA